jgi:hypothetical protein
MQSTAAATHQEVTSTPDTAAVTPMLIRVAERFGLPVVLLLLVLWWARGDVVQPLLDAHFNFIDKVVAGQERHSQEVRELGDKLDTLIEIAREK